MISKNVRVFRTPTGLEASLNRTFVNAEVLKNALTHSTYVNEYPNEGPDFQRLAFLGDAVLGLMVARLLFEQFKDATEVELSQRRDRVVQRDTLAELATRLGLGDHIRVGAGQKRDIDGVSKRILADAFEALAGAIYLDGGYQAVEQCLRRVMMVGIERTQEFQDYKTRLQEICHRLGLPVPAYKVVGANGPDHERYFKCEVRIGGQTRGSGAGATRRAAEQMCAQRVLDAFTATPTKVLST